MKQLSEVWVEFSIRPVEATAVVVRTLATPLGALRVAASERGVIHVDWSEGAPATYLDAQVNEADAPTAIAQASVQADEAVSQLLAYFAGERTTFDVSLQFRGTPFQESVWRALSAIPYGETRTYRDIAITIGNPKAVRAVGQANRRNPIAVIIPCHRVIGADGDLVGYAGSQIGLKEGLLNIERRQAGRLN